MLPLQKERMLCQGLSKQKNYMNSTVAEEEDRDHDYQVEDPDLGHIFHQLKFKDLSTDWLLLDNKSILGQSVNKAYLTDIQTVGKPIKKKCLESFRCGTIWMGLQM